MKENKIISKKITWDEDRNRRFKFFFDFKNLSQEEFSIIMNYSQPNLNAILNNKRALGEKIINYYIIPNFPELNKNWLLTGEGEMLNYGRSNSSEQIEEISEMGISNVDVYNKYPTNYSRMPTVITVQDDQEENIELVPVRLAAGYVGGGYAEDGFVEELPKFRLPFLKNGTFRCFGIVGHSMDRIQDEDWFVGRFVDNLKDFHEGKVHAVIAPEAGSLLIKRVFRNPDRNDMLILRSDNNDIVNTYPDIHIHMNYIKELWSYSALISFKEPSYDMGKFRDIISTNPKFSLIE